MTPRFFVLFFVALAVACSPGCGRKSPAPEEPKVKGETPVFGTVTPQPKPVDQPARIEAYQETPLVVRIPGFIKEIYVDKGSRVNGPKKDAGGKITKPGDLIAVLGVPEMRVDLEQKEKLIQQADAEVKFAEASVTAANAEHDFLKSQFERFEKIGPDGVDKKGVLDKNAVAEARYSYETAKAKRDMAKADVDVKKARLEVARKARDSAAEMLSYAEIRAPYDGVITQRNVHTGKLLEPGASGSPPFVIAQSGSFRVVSDVPEVEASYVHNKMLAKVRVPALGNRVFAGTSKEPLRVARTSWAREARERTLRVEIDLPADEALVPGMYAYVSLRAAERRTLPSAAILGQDAQPYCYLLQDGKAKRTPLKLGARSGDVVEILEKQVAS